MTVVAIPQTEKGATVWVVILVLVQAGVVALAHAFADE